MSKTGEILIVDDQIANLKLLNTVLKKHGYKVRQAKDGEPALRAVEYKKPDLILLDINMPGMDGYEVCERLKADIETDYIPVIFLTAQIDEDAIVRGLLLGAADYVTKPFKEAELLARVDTHLRMYFYERELERLVEEKVEEVIHVRQANNYALLSAAEFRDPETGYHIKRTSLYTELMANHLGLDSEHVKIIKESAPYHDVGKIGIPDRILLKQGPLDIEEEIIMKTHSEKGYHWLRAQLELDPNNDYVRIGSLIALNHHERMDGTGFPNGISGQEIPIEARIFAIADVYDALSSKRPYKEPFSHEKSVDILINGDGRTDPGHFDANVLQAFKDLRIGFKKVRDKYID